VGRESFYKITPAAVPKNVMVVGGGPAGMEAARVAKLRGHNVTLYESSGQLGGNFIAAAVPDFKFDDKMLIEWYRNEIKELKINVNLNTTATEKLIEEKQPDILIIATGAKEKRLDVPGIEKAKVATAVELLNGIKQAGKNVLMIGGGLVGCETALYLAQKGKNVTIVEAMDDIMSAGHPVPHMNKIMLIDLLKMHNVKIITGNALLEVTDEGAVLIGKNFRKQSLTADTIAIAVGFDPNRELYDKVSGRIVDLYRIGDAEVASNIMNAIWSAYEIALTF
jgi:2-enoate reductase